MSKQYDTLEEQVSAMARDMERLLGVRGDQEDHTSDLAPGSILPAAQGYVVENGVRKAPLAAVAMAQTILCPRCGLRQTAYVTKHPLAFWPAYAHVCLRCEYYITESEWKE